MDLSKENTMKEFIKLFHALALTLLISFSFNAKAMSMYGGGSYSFAGVIAESDFYNGAKDWAPGLIFGFRLEIVAFELFLKKFTLQNDHEVDGVTYSLEVTDLVYGGGLRLQLIRGIDLLMGVNTQNVSTEYIASDSNKQLDNAIDKHYLSWYVGGGLRGEIYPGFETRLDLAYYKGDIEYGLFGIDFALVYHFTSL